MINIGPNNSRTRASVATLCAVVALTIFSYGCSSNYGRFSKDAQVSQAFQNGAVQPDFSYYYSGRDTMPYAILAVDHGYTVPSRYWIPFDPEPVQLKKMSQNIYRYYYSDPYGSNILDPDGKVVGVWYSNLLHKRLTVDPNNRTVQVLFQNPESVSRGR